MIFFHETKYRNSGIFVDSLNDEIVFYAPGTSQDSISTIQIELYCKNIGIALIPWKWKFDDFPDKMTKICKISEFVDIKYESINQQSKVIIIHFKGEFESPVADISFERVEMARNQLKTIS